MPSDIHDTGTLRPFLRYQAGNIEMAAVQGQIHMLSQVTGDADRCIIGCNIAVGDIDSAIPQCIIGTDIFVQIAISRATCQMERSLCRRLVETTRHGNRIIGPACKRNISPSQCWQQPFQTHMLCHNLQIHLPGIQISHTTGSMSPIVVTPHDRRYQNTASTTGKRAVDTIKVHPLYTAVAGMENQIPVRSGTI